MRGRPRRVAAFLAACLACTALALPLTAQGVSSALAHRVGDQFTIEVQLAPGTPPTSQPFLSRCTVLPSGKEFWEKMKLRPKRGAPGEFRLPGPAVNPRGVEVRAGDRVRLEFLLDGTPIDPITVTVTEGKPATAAAKPAPVRPPVAAAPAAAPAEEGAPATAEAPPVVQVPAEPLTPASVTEAAPPATGLPVAPPVVEGLGALPEKPAVVAVPAPVRIPASGQPPAAAAPSTAAEATLTAPQSEPAVVQTPAPAAVEEEVAPAATGEAPEAPPWIRYAPWIGGGVGVLLLTLVGAVVSRGRSARRATGAQKAIAAAGGLGLGEGDPPARPARPATPPAPLSGGTDASLAEAESLGIHVESLIARGGLCDIFLARRGSDRRRCALKVLRPEFRSSASLSEGLVREGEIIRQLNESYPGQVFITLFDQGVFHDDGTDHPYLVLEYVDGPNLRAHVRQNGALEPFTAISAARALADGLARVHESGFVHGDISPENVLWVSNATLRRSGEPRFRLIDFGDSRKFDLDDRAEEIAGKPPFLSPEQTLGAAASPASDVYSLGMVLYFLLAGRPAFESANSLDVLRMHREAPLRFPTAFGAEVCEAIALLCDKDPDRRPSSGETIDLLESLLSSTRGVA